VIKFLIIHRRQIGIITFLFAFAHAFLIVNQRNIDLFDWRTYWIYIQGITTLIIFTCLTITSNNWSVKKLKKNWNRIHSLTYLAMFLLSWHIWDKMFGHWSFLTPLALLKLAIIIILFFIRKNIEFKKNLK
jgi:sulfoxide reductase heme-binding subunit YedZ